MNQKVSIIVFSKGRPMQMHAYLESLFRFSEATQEMVSVLLCETKEISYSKVKAQFPKVTWITERDFEKDLKNLVNQAEEYIMFGCDDVVFTHDFSLERACNFLSLNDNVFGFSIRLGKNILPSPRDAICRDGVMRWNWEKADAIRYDYPWELDCTIYRKEDVVKLIEEESGTIKNPNFLEAMITLENRGRRIVRKELACYEAQGNAIVITVNRVQDSHPNGFDDSMLTDIYSLNRLYNEEGNCLDIEKISQKKTNVIHVESDFFILKKSAKGFSKYRIVKKKLRNIMLFFQRKIKKPYNYLERRIYKKNLYLKRIHVLNAEDSFRKISQERISFVRMGNNEISLMQGYGVATQSYDKQLAQRLVDIFSSNDSGFMTGIPYHYIRYGKFTPYYERFMLSIQNQRNFLKKICKKNKQYLDSGITQVYQIYSNVAFHSYYTEWKNLFSNHKITVICNEDIISKLKYNILAECKDIEYMYAPSMNAYEHYDQILEEALLVDKNRLICVMLGPTAKVLIYDLYKNGYQAWDIGHLLKDYDAYMNKMARTDANIDQFYLPD